MTVQFCPRPVAPRPRAAERKVFRKRKRLPGPKWFERNVVVPVGSRKGQYRNSNNPALYSILDWATRPYIRTIVLGKGIQIGGTLGFYGLLLREGEYTADNALVVVADERTLKKLIKKRLQKMIDGSPSLAAIKSSNPDETTMYSITLANGFTIDGAWASSETSVSSESYRVVILDEISKYKTLGNIEDAKARTTVFPDTHRIWILSSPGIDTEDPENRDPLTKEAEACDVMMEYYATCPDCGSEQVMTFDRFRWPGQANLAGEIEADPKTIRRLKSAWYECDHCSGRWNDYKRDKAVLAAMTTGWRSTDQEEIPQPRSVYFHFPSWLSPYVSLSDVVADWLEAQGDDIKLQKWHNRHGGVAYIHNRSIRPWEELLKLRDERPRGIVPEEAHIILMSADTQQNGFWYEVRAFRFGLDLKSWQVREGYAESFAELTEIADIPYLTASGKEFRISMESAVIDSGGGTGPIPQHSRTHEVYAFCLQDRRFIPVKGMSNADAQKVRKKAVDFWPGSNKPIKGGLHRLNINTTLFKNELSGKLNKHPDDQGAWVLHSETDAPYAKQLTAESFIDGKWTCPKGRDNHYWDCGVYVLALAEYKQLKMKKAASPAAPERTRKTYSPGVTHDR
jgi:phage terminase large subunit GpA-like protein